MLMQAPGQQYRSSDLVQLQTAPTGAAINPAILRKTAIGPLERREPDQRPERCSGLAGGQQRGGALHEVSGPDEMITAQVVVPLSLTPGNTHGCDERTLKYLILVGQLGAGPQIEDHGILARIKLVAQLIRSDTSRAQFMQETPPLPVLVSDVQGRQPDRQGQSASADPGDHPTDLLYLAAKEIPKAKKTAPVKERPSRVHAQELAGAHPAHPGQWWCHRFQAWQEFRCQQSPQAVTRK